jgi:hypothetical protein
VTDSATPTSPDPATPPWLLARVDHLLADATPAEARRILDALRGDADIAVALIGHVCHDYDHGDLPPDEAMTAVRDLIRRTHVSVVLP